MDAIRAHYRTPTLASSGELVAATKRIGPPPDDDVTFTGHLKTEGSVGFFI
jgi:hypothetical protein